jgi:hypothetical protein
VTNQELLRLRADHLRAISQLQRHRPGHEFAYQRAAALDNAAAIAVRRVAITEIDAELAERRRKDQHEQHEQGRTTPRR